MLAPDTTVDAVEGRNHPLAVRMAAIAFLNQNLAIGCIFGSISILLAPVEARLGIGREQSTLAVPAVTLATAVCAPIVGALAARVSLRLMMLVGALLGTAGFLLLATTASLPLYVAAYGLLLGPGMAVAVILPSVLVTRWFTVNRGKAMGLITAQVVIIFVPIVATQMLASRGLPATYLMLAALSAVGVIANLFIVDHPPGSEPAAGGGAHGGEGGGITMAGLLRTWRFHALLAAFVAANAVTVAVSTHLVPLVGGWGLTTGQAATLVSVQSACGIAGTLAFGWIADRLGGARALLIVAVDYAVLSLLLLMQPGFVGAVVLIGLIGMHGAGVLPAVGVALSEAFGRDSFSRAYGLGNLMNLPFSVACVPVSAMIYTRTGSYSAAIVGGAVFLALGAAAVSTTLGSRQRRD